MHCLGCRDPATQFFGPRTPGSGVPSLIIGVELPGWVPTPLPSFSPDSQGPLAFGPLAGHLGEVWDLIWPNSPPLNWWRSTTFALDSFPKKMHCLGCTDLQKHSLASPSTGWGTVGSNICVDLSGVDVVLHAKFQPWGSNHVAAYSGQTHTHADPYHIYIFFCYLCLFLCGIPKKC